MKNLFKKNLSPLLFPFYRTIRSEACFAAHAIVGSIMEGVNRTMYDDSPIGPLRVMVLDDMFKKIDPNNLRHNMDFQ